MAKRLMGQKHVKKGRLSRGCLGENTAQAKSVKVAFRYVSGIHTSPQVDITEPVLRYRSAKSSMRIEPNGEGLLQQAGPRISPKALVKPNHGNSGLATGRKPYANGDLVVARKFSSEGGQFSTTAESCVDSQYTLEETVAQSDIGADIKVGCYSTLLHPKIYKIAYESIKSKPGNTTPADKQTLDGIGKAWVSQTIHTMKDRSFQFKPAVRKHIPKPNGKLRPLGIPTPKDKVVMQALRLIIEPLFEPHFLNTCHGFRPNRSAHSALREIKSWTGITWMIEGDIVGCFDNVNHHILERLLKSKIKDHNLISLYWKAVNAGYVNNGALEPHSLTGVPQGGVLSSLLSNVYMHELDVFVEGLRKEHTVSRNRTGTIQNPEYTAATRKLKKLRTALHDVSEIRKVEAERERIPSVIRTGTRIYYARYADDWVIGVRGPRSLAVKIKQQVEAFLRNELNLELNQDKTAITHLSTEKAFFLGSIIRRHPQSYMQGLIRKVGNRRVRRSNTRILLECPINKIVSKLIDQGYAHTDGTPKAVTKWIHMKPEDIILRFNGVLRGYLNYYSFANNRNMMQRIVWILTFSAVFTFARKWNLSPKKVFKKLGNPPTYKTETETRRGTKVVSYRLDQGDLAISPMKFDLIKNDKFIDPAKIKYFSLRSHFSLDKPCCICGSLQEVEMHHIRHLRKDTPRTNNPLKRLFLQLKRKQIPVCKTCHRVIHQGKYDGKRLGSFKDE